MANASREVAAYILIGVEEIRGGRSTIVGVQNHLDDANLPSAHQFQDSEAGRVLIFLLFLQRF